MRGDFREGDVAALRRFVGLSQRAFAAALGINVQTLRNWSRDGADPRAQQLALLSVAARHPRILHENVALAG